VVRKRLMAGLREGVSVAPILESRPLLRTLHATNRRHAARVAAAPPRTEPVLRPAAPGGPRPALPC